MVDGLRGRVQPLPTKRSQLGGVVLQVGVAVVAGVRALPSRGTWAAIGVGLTAFALAVAVWWLLGRWFTLVVATEAMGAGLVVALRAVGLDHGLFAGLIAGLPAVSLLLVGNTATWMQGLRAVVVTPLDPRDVEVGQPALDELQASGFRTEADLAYGLYGNATVVAAFRHRSLPVYAEVSRSFGGAAHPSGVVTLLQGGGALETETGASFPRGSSWLRQVFPRADLATLTRRHLEALAWLRQRGVVASPATPGTYAISVESMLDGTAAAVQAHPLWHAAHHVVLRVLRRHLDQGPLQGQRDLGGRVQVPAGV